jgi:hypothetical protein
VSLKRVFVLFEVGKLWLELEDVFLENTLRGQTL